MKIAIVEDAPTIRNELTAFLKNYNYDVFAPDHFEDIISEINNAHVHLILLDINLPVYDGFYICRELRKESNVPIIIVTSRDTEMDELMSMNLGADDFITKPYNTQILLARIESILRRVYEVKADAKILSFKQLQLHLSNGTIVYNESTVELTKNEMKILHCLIEHADSIVSREQLMEELWSSNMFVDDNTLSVNIARLRKKIEAIGMKNPIETRRGLGYILT